MLFSIAWLGLCAVVFLTLAGFFTAWEGKAVSVRQNEPNQPVYQVLIAPAEGERFDVSWPRIAVTGLNLKVDRRAIPQLPLPDDLPTTKKERFSLSFTVTPNGGTAHEVRTNVAQTATIALLLFVMGLGMRNMMVAGSPISLDPKGVTLPKAQAPMGRAAQPKAKPGKARGRKGPPPGKPRRGSGRRR